MEKLFYFFKFIFLIIKKLYEIFFLIIKKNNDLIDLKLIYKIRKKIDAKLLIVNLTKNN